MYLKKYTGFPILHRSRCLSTAHSIGRLLIGYKLHLGHFIDRLWLLELREGLEPTKSFLHSFADCVLCRSDSPQHIKEDLYWIHFNELNSGDAPPTQYKSCLITGVGIAPTEAGLWDPLEDFFAPLVNIIYNKHVLCFKILSITHRVRSATAIECWIVPEIGFEPMTHRLWFCRSDQTELHRNNFIHIVLYNLFHIFQLHNLYSASPACRPQLLGFSVRSNHWIWIERQNRFSFD